MLAQLFESQVLDGATTAQRFVPLANGQSRWEMVLMALFRARSQKVIPLECAALSIVWLYYRVLPVVWDGIGHFTRAVMSKTWAV